MPGYHSLGRLPAKRHMAFYDERERLLYEEVVGTEGFSGIYSTLYHYALPPASRDPVALDPVRPEPAAPGPQRHRHARTALVEPGGDPISGRRLLLFNQELSLALAAPDQPMGYFYKNGVCDELLFIHQGTGALESQLGDLDLRAGDYVYLPRGLIYRLRFETGARMLVLEAAGQIGIPRRYRNEQGQLLEHAPYCERDFRRPSRLQSRDEPGRYELLLKLGDALSLRALDQHPFDVAGWDGYLYPWAFSIHDFEPRCGRFHLPPTAHQTFEGPGFVVCSFVPRLLDWDPRAVPIPYYHSNLDSDELIYYVSGSYAARRGVEPGSITLHPRGLPHGPQAGAIEAALGAPRQTDELAVMVDTFRPLALTAQMDSLDDPAYQRSWTR